MSLHLGKIHYWLFNKIIWFQNLEKDIIELAQNEEIVTNDVLDKINLKYGEMLPNSPLEDLIDKTNIHGWLQEKIILSESRMAEWTKVILKCNNGELKLENVYIKQGMKAGQEALKNKKSFNTAKEIYNGINDYILDGMPCDRVDEVLYYDDLKIQWRKRICVHKKIWEELGVDVKIFYHLRALWIKAFVTEVNSNFYYDEKADGTMIIQDSMMNDEILIYDLD